MARCLCVDEDEAKSKHEIGIAHALRRFSEDSATILNGRNIIANSIIDSRTNPQDARMQCARAIIRSSSYINERNLPYSSPAWNVLRGVAPPESILKNLDRRSCCAISGLDEKIFKAALKDKGTSMEKESNEGLVRTLSVMQKAVFALES